MSFISVDFALFVAVALLLYYLIPVKYRWVILLVASYTFYWMNGPENMWYILFTTVSTYAGALLIEKKTKEKDSYLADNPSAQKEEKKAFKANIKKKQRLILAACLFANFGILLYLKYANFAIAHINLFRLTHYNRTDFIPFIRVLLPLGISFYIFQSMGYLFDLYYGKITAERNFLRFALYVSFFPQIVQGPISRFSQLAPSLYGENRFDFNNIRSGFYLIMWGLFKKLVIADRLAGFVRETIAMNDRFHGLYALMAVFGYSMQIYGDFSGGIDVASGVATMFGVKLPRNFERPFFSKSISEYWQRWHITLGTWFKDYIYYPLSLNKTVINASKKLKAKNMGGIAKRIPIYVPMFFVWILTGMWHGSKATFVVWGLFNFLFIVLGTELAPVSGAIVKKTGLSERGFVLRAYRAVKTFWLMTFLRIFDLSETVPEAFTIFKSMFKDWGSFDIKNVYEYLMIPQEDLIVAAAAVAVLFIFELIQRKGSVRERIFALPVPVQWIILCTLVTVVSVFGYYGPGYDAQSFIYGAF